MLLDLKLLEPAISYGGIRYVVKIYPKDLRLLKQEVQMELLFLPSQIIINNM